jgi:hypothetical protein
MPCKPKEVGMPVNNTPRDRGFQRSKTYQWLSKSLADVEDVPPAKPLYSSVSSESALTAKAGAKRCWSRFVD